MYEEKYNELIKFANAWNFLKILHVAYNGDMQSGLTDLLLWRNRSRKRYSCKYKIINLFVTRIIKYLLIMNYGKVVWFALAPNEKPIGIHVNNNMNYLQLEPLLTSFS